MLEFQDEAIVLGARAHGETGAVAHVLTQEHGVWAAHVAGGASRRMKAVLQPGARAQIAYQARDAGRLGSARLEAIDATPDVLDDALALTGLQSACAMTRLALPEREAQPGVYHALSALLGLMDMPEVWPAVYVRYEAGLLEALGFGLDLSACAVSGGHDDLIYVSPKSGRAVSRAAGAPYHDRLLALPPFLLSSQGGLGEGDIARGLELTGFFLERHVFHPHNQPLPEIRRRLAEALR
jgi:DNA repair protein RecO (recombination protein O)